MSPPKLTRDTPVLNILKPVLICCNILAWIELQLTREYWWKGDICHVLHSKEPLLTETRLYGSILITL